MNMRRLIVTTVAVVALLGACGGGDDDDSATNEDSASGVTAAAPSDARDGVPDACDVFTSAQLAAAFGGEPGTGKAAGSGSRRVCTFAGGIAVGVSEANQYDGSLSLAKANGSTCADTSGVGDKASFCNVYGQVGQLFWLKGNLMYDVTAATVDEARFKSLAAQAA
jgi:hypothetical protein